MRVWLYWGMAAAAFALAATGIRAAEPNLTHTSGRITQFDQGGGLISVHTRLGQQSFRVTAGTLIVLNNHTGAQADLTAGAEVEIDYRFDTLEAQRIEIHKEAKLRGRVTAFTATNLTLKTKGAVAVTITTNGLSRFFMEGIRLEQTDPLVGILSDAVYEPGTGRLLLRMNGDVDEFLGIVKAVDDGADTVTVGGKKPRTFTLHPGATIRNRAGDSIALADVAVGKRLFVAWVRIGGVSTALAMRLE